jgi:hypothetical protein
MDPKKLTKKYIWKTRMFFCNVCHSTKVMPSRACSEDVIVMHPCGHRFCGSCVTDIIYGSKTECPTCRTDSEKYVWYTGRGRGKGKDRMKEQWSVDLKQSIVDQEFADSLERLRNQRDGVDELEKTSYCMTVSSAYDTEESKDSLLSFRQMRKIDEDNIKSGNGITASFISNPEKIIFASTPRTTTSYAQGLMRKTDHYTYSASDSIAMRFFMISAMREPMTGPMLTRRAPFVTEPPKYMFEYQNSSSYRHGKMMEDSIIHPTVKLEFACNRCKNKQKNDPSFVCPHTWRNYKDDDDDDDEILALEPETETKYGRFVFASTPITATSGIMNILDTFIHFCDIDNDRDILIKQGFTSDMDTID